MSAIFFCFLTQRGEGCQRNLFFCFVAKGFADLREQGHPIACADWDGRGAKIWEIYLSKWMFVGFRSCFGARTFQMPLSFSHDLGLV